MTKTKKIIIGIVIVALIVAAAVFAAIHFEVFGHKAYNYDMSKYVKVGDYKGLEYDKISVSVSDKEIKSEIDTRCQNAATTEKVTTGTVEDGDTINVAYEGKIDGKTFDGGSSDSYDITIGQTSMIDGFTDGLIGAKVGDKVTLNLKFPDDYSQTDVAGKDVVFEVTVNSKQVTTVPEYNLDFIKANSDYDNVKDYEESVKKDLLKSKTEEAENTVKNDLWSKITENSKVIKYPEEELKSEQEVATKQYKDMADSYGVEWEEFMTTYLGYDDEKAFNKGIKEYAQSVVKQKMIMYYIADKEKVDVSKKEYSDYLNNLLDEAGMTADSFKEMNGTTIEEYAEEQGWESQLLLNKVLDKVMELGKEKSA